MLRAPGRRAMSGAFAKERLARMHGVMAGYVDRGEMPGFVTLLCRRDEVHVRCGATRSSASRR
jgi:hypothetical protein